MLLGKARTRRRSSHQVARTPASSESASAVLERAATLIGKPVPATLVEALNTAEVLWDWQLSGLSDDDFERLGCSLGLKVAIRNAASSASRSRSLDELPEALRRFLLVPEPDGSPKDGSRRPAALAQARPLARRTRVRSRPLCHVAMHGPWTPHHPVPPPPDP